MEKLSVIEKFDYASLDKRISAAKDWANFDKSLRSAIVNAFKSYRAPPPEDKEYDFEFLLSDIKTLLENCLSYRREYNEICGAAVRQGLEYELFWKTAELNETLELAEWQAAQRSIELDAQSKSYNEFIKDESAIALGYASISAGNISLAKNAIENDALRHSLIKSRWEAMRSHQRALETRHKAEGHPLNYKERANAVKEFLIRDLLDCYLKAHHVKNACDSIFLWPAEISLMPDPDAPDLINELIQWHHKINRRLDIELRRETEFEYIVSAVSTAPGGTRVVPQAEWEKAFAAAGNHKIEYNLDAVFKKLAPSKISNLRLRGIGVSVNFASPNVGDHRALRLSAIVSPPFDRAPFGEIPRVPFIIASNVVMTDQFTKADYQSPNDLLNKDPAGSWAVQLSKSVYYMDITARTTASLVSDVKLHFLLRGRVNNGDLGDFTW